MLRYLLLLLVMIVALVVSTACETLIGPRTPAETVRQSYLRGSPENAATFRVVATRQWARGAVVLYTYVLAVQARPPLQILCYVLVEPSGGGLWRTNGGAEAGTAVAPAGEELISYSTAGGTDQVRGDFSIVYGHSFAPEVAFVEATFDNDLILRDGAADGFFVLITSTNAAPCELRALDVQSEVLQRIDVARCHPRTEQSVLATGGTDDPDPFGSARCCSR